MAPKQEYFDASVWLQLLPELAKFLAAFVAGFLSNVLVERRDRRKRVGDAKDKFLVTISELKAKLSALCREEHRHFNPNEDTFFKASVNEVTAAALKLRPFISETEWSRLELLLKEYQEHKEQYTGLTRASVDLKSGNTFVQRLEAFLDSFYRLFAD
ncbi:MAG: hypothetical protein RL514_970 [Verrucomicrobiota bacterium]|jgi:hypothetical protein